MTSKKDPVYCQGLVLRFKNKPTFTSANKEISIRSYFTERQIHNRSGVTRAGQRSLSHSHTHWRPKKMTGHIWNFTQTRLKHVLKKSRWCLFDRIEQMCWLTQAWLAKKSGITLQNNDTHQYFVTKLRVGEDCGAQSCTPSNSAVPPATRSVCVWSVCVCKLNSSPR